LCLLRQKNDSRLIVECESCLFVHREQNPSARIGGVLTMTKKCKVVTFLRPVEGFLVSDLVWYGGAVDRMESVLVHDGAETCTRVEATPFRQTVSEKAKMLKK
jgi:hypothetical protein